MYLFPDRKHLLFWTLRYLRWSRFHSLSLGRLYENTSLPPWCCCAMQLKRCFTALSILPSLLSPTICPSMQQPQTRTSANQAEFNTAQLLQTTLRVGLELEVKENKSGRLTRLPNTGSKSEISQLLQLVQLCSPRTMLSHVETLTHSTPCPFLAEDPKKKKEPSRAVKIHNVFKDCN